MEKLIQLPRFAREAQFQAASFDEASNSIEVVWTTGARVRRRSWIDGPYDEELVVDAGSVRLDRLNAGAPFLNTHNDYDLSDIIGCVVPGTARIEGAKGLARIQLSRATDDATVVQKIRDGLIRNTSVGYLIHKVEKTEADDGTVPVWRVTDWEPMEISAVPIPADAGAQIRADKAVPGQALYACTLQINSAAADAARSRMRMRTRRAGLTRA